MTVASTLPNVSNLGFVEDLYREFLRDPSSLAAEWRDYFSGMANGDRKASLVHLPALAPRSLFHAPAAQPADALSRQAAMQDRVTLLIRLYRVRGHNLAQVDPLGQERPTPPELQPEFLHFTEADMDVPVQSETFPFEGRLTLRELIEKLRNTYCRSIGVQYMHIDDLAVRRWLQRRMEATENHSDLSRDEQLRILTRLTDAVTFEEFIRKKFVGAKTFSLDGSESLIPLLDLAIEKAADQGVEEIVLAMAHRGRLNVLANVMGKSARQIFREFADADWKTSPGRGDVKYHLGHESEWTTAAGKKIHLALCFNPSHLEFVNPIALGRARARQDCAGDEERARSMAILIHGDAAFAGEGIIQETLNLSQLPGFTVGGTLHVIVNNQIGFTTSPEEARSSQYASDVARMLQIPIFHVNGEDPEAVAQVVRLAMDFRREFRRDVVIDMYGYRRLGHNENDEPSFTQPVLYRAIARRKSVREGYLDHLLQLGGVTRDEADLIAAGCREMLERELSQSQREAGRVAPAAPDSVRSGAHGVTRPTLNDATPNVPREKLSGWLKTLSETPPDFHPHPKIKKFLESRRQMAAGEQPIDWSAAEALAFVSLAAEGVRVRLSGQDSERGTFSHRHAVLHDYQNGRPFASLQTAVEADRRTNRRDEFHESPISSPANRRDEFHESPISSPANRRDEFHESPISSPCRPIEVVNSPLSETGVLGFEYGYTLDCPRALVLWEAQYGDFWNVAQPIVDQFIASGEDKWGQCSGIVLLLPHGFEGAGPEHSSARLERFLWLAAEDNIQVVYPTTPAQYFHCLRRQALRSSRKPLIVMSPKSLLRHPQVISSFDHLATGGFQPVLADLGAPREAPRRVLLCSGKIYYELAQRRDELKRNDVAIVRLEQLYPLDLAALERALQLCPAETPVFWVQEEPANMGAWNFLKIQFGGRLLGKYPLHGIARPVSATPATGSGKRHKQEQADIIKQAFDEATGSRSP
jgi:2-oxoglutarate dehydrogenase E1 component